MLNCDRNDSNILVRKSQNKQNPRKYNYQLLPIDHGLSLPDTFEIYEDELCWFYWRQVEKPITKKWLDVIEKIDPFEDAKELASKLYFRDRCLRNFIIVNMLLKMGAKKGLTLSEIAQIIYKEDGDDRSILNDIASRAAILTKNNQILEEE